MKNEKKEAIERLKKTRTKLSKSKQNILLKNSGKAIEKFRAIKYMSTVVLSNKTNLSLSDVDNICNGKKIPTKEQVKSICKALDIPKEVILLYCFEAKDVAPRKRKFFKICSPLLKDMIETTLIPKKNVRIKKINDAFEKKLKSIK